MRPMKRPPRVVGQSDDDDVCVRILDGLFHVRRRLWQSELSGQALGTFL